jgi:hypothetical protein
MSDFDFDFGFTAVDENELDAVQQISKVAEKSSQNFDQVQEKVDNLYNAMTPLLNNLKKNPEKEYILWPNRIEKVEEFEEYLKTIYNA